MSVNVDKALQVRPPTAVYAYNVTGNGISVALPGVPNNIGGAAPGGAHTVITNFLTLQHTDPSALPVGYLLDGSPDTDLSPPGGIDLNTNVAPDPPVLITGQFALLMPGESVRFDLSDLFDHALPQLSPVQYLHMAYQSEGSVDVRFWRSSGR